MHLLFTKHGSDSNGLPGTGLESAQYGSLDELRRPIQAAKPCLWNKIRSRHHAEALPQNFPGHFLRRIGEKKLLREACLSRIHASSMCKS